MPVPGSDPWGAIQWFTGGRSDPADPRADPQMAGRSPLALWSEHLTCESEIRMMDTYREASFKGTEVTPAEAMLPMVTPRIYAENIKALTASLRRIREAMREQGMTPPPLRPETIRIIGDDWSEEV